MKKCENCNGKGFNTTMSQPQYNDGATLGKPYIEKIPCPKCKNSMLKQKSKMKCNYASSYESLNCCVHKCKNRRLKDSCFCSEHELNIKPIEEPEFYKFCKYITSKKGKKWIMDLVKKYEKTNTK